MVIGKGSLLSAVILVGVVTMSQGDPPQGAPSPTNLDRLEKRLNELQTSIGAHDKRLTKLEQSLRPLLRLSGASEAAGQPQDPTGAGAAAMSLVEVRRVLRLEFQKGSPMNRLTGTLAVGLVALLTMGHKERGSYGYRAVRTIR